MIKKKYQIFHKKHLSFKKIYLYFGLTFFLFIVVFLYFTETLKKINESESQTIPQLFSKHLVYSRYESYNSMFYHFYLKDLINNIKNPIIITTEDDIPICWINIEIPDTLSYDEINQNQKEYVNQQITEMKKRGHLFYSRIKLYPDRLVKIKTYYEDLSVIKRMRLIPVLQILGLLMLMTGGIYLFFIISQNEKDNLWIGMAKETAHQFGTPVTALMGWIELLKLRTGEQHQDILANMEIDLTLLQKTANRFNKIGSKLSFKPHDITELINESVRYFRLRLPHFNSKINILFINQSDNLYLNIDADLFKWSLENLIKNSIDAMKNKAGNIFIQLSYSKKKIHIIVMDEGCGIPKNISWKQIFEPGVTSKNRGWGLGLSLTKRIVEDYFKGSIKVLRSVPNDGCVIEICLPENLICRESKTS